MTLIEANEITLTKEELNAMLLKAFSKGEAWGVTYSTWFSPTEEENTLRASTDCLQVYVDALSKQELNKGENVQGI
jgi:hypothetical protein